MVFGIQKYRREGKVSSPVLFGSFRTFRCVGHGVGQAVDPHFDPHLKVHFYNEKHLKSEDFRCFLELLGRFELPTSSLPTAVEPSSPCCSRLFGNFLSKKEEVAACLFHCFRPCVSKLYPRKWTRDFDPWSRSADTHLTHRVRSAAPVL